MGSGFNQGLGDLGKGLQNMVTGGFQGAGHLAQGNVGEALHDAYRPFENYATGIGKMIGIGVQHPDVPDMASPQNIVPTSTPEQVMQQYMNVQSGLAQQQEFAQALKHQNGLSNQTEAFNNARNMANGTGPNPAMAQLANATGANVANQAALMAGQRGAGANAGLMARQSANQGSNIQQHAAGQAAVLQAQQQLGGQQQMAQIAQQQVGNYGQATGGFNQFALGAQGNVLNGANSSNQLSMQQANALNNYNLNKYNVQQGNAAADAQQAGNTIKGLASIYTGGAAGALGGAATMAGAGGGGAPSAGGVQSVGGEGAAPGVGFENVYMASGGAVPQIGNHGPRSSTSQYLSQAKQLKSGGAVPGHAQAPGNSYRNDTVHAMLSPGEIVIPRSIMQSKNPAEAAKQFVAAVLAKHGVKK